MLALIANVNRDPKKTKPFKPSDFHPHFRREAEAIPKVKMSEVKDILKRALKPSRKPRQKRPQGDE